ncbi:hypothetical protein RUM43_004077 [Polyplax serrata]|uniref:5-demethoxyubiquinone hydroxylase, mitochondrial n=1 Tax=Polyplax serrata TaxID=468196 RepID=A0AAN8SAZ2_POLSC
MNFQPFSRTSFCFLRKFSSSPAGTNTAKPNPLIDSIIRVNHAGELGADRIYAGQMAVLGNSKMGPLIQHMWDQEKVHKATFEKLIVEHRVRPTALTPVWNAVGYLLGAGTALLGEKAAMACTVAVESVIVEHYNDQLRTLMSEPEKNKELMDTIKKFRDEEQEHHDCGVDHGAEQAPFYSLLSEVIKFGCKQAIEISKGFLSVPNQYNYVSCRNYSTSTRSQPKPTWDLYSAVCVERKPLILKPLNEIEKKIAVMFLELEDEKSCKSDHEIKGEEDTKRALLVKNAATLSDADIENSLQQTAHEFEEASDKEFENFQPESRITSKDENKNFRSLDRELSNHLLLLVSEKVGDSMKWILPHGLRKDTETMREAAERVLMEKCGDKLKVLFLGNAPCGFHKYKYPKSKEGNAVGAKIFFFKAIHLSGQVDTAHNKLDYKWAARHEMKQFMDNETYFRNVSMFLIDDEDVPQEKRIKSK